MKKTQNNTFDLFLYHNIIPLVTSAVIIAVSWASLGSQIALLNQKVDYLVQSQKELLESRRGIETRYGNLTLDVKELQTLLNIKK